MKKLRALILALSTVAALYAGCLALLYFGQGALLYPAPPPQEVRPLPGMSLLTLTADGHPAYALWMPPAKGRTVIVDYHGNAGQLEGQVDEAERYSAFGVGYFATEYPGYGMAHGQVTSEQAIYGAAQAGLEHLTGALGVAKSNIVLLGRSLGTGVAVEMARRGWGARLVLASAYTSIPDVGAVRYGMFPVHALARDHFDSLSKAPSIEIPVLLLHGEDDRVVPFVQGKRLSEAFPHGTLVPFPGLGHDDVLDGPGTRERVVAFATGAGS